MEAYTIMRLPKKLCRILLFLAILCLLLTFASLIFIPKDNTEQAGIYKASANAIRSQSPGSIDVVFLGDSEAYSSFIPLELFEQTGISSFVVSSLDQKMYETLELLQMAFRYQSPKLVVLEANVLYRVYPSTDTLTAAVESRIPTVRYHNRWKSLTLQDFFHRPSYTAQSPDRGYHLLLTSEEADISEYMRPMEEWEPLSRQNRGFLEDILRLCQENQAQLLLFSAPSPRNWTIRRHNTVTDTATELGIPYIDGNLESLDIDWTQDSYDGGDHLNYYGASKTTAWLGEYLATNYTLADHRQEQAYKSWHEDAQAFRLRLEEGSK